MSRRRGRDHGRFRRLGSPDGLAAMSADYLDHSFPAHAHDTFVVGVVEAGAAVVHAQGRSVELTRDHVLVINPDVVHSARSNDAAGWRYRAFYPSPALVRQVLGEAHARTFPELRIRDRGLADRLRAGIVALVETDDPLLAASVSRELITHTWRYAVAGAVIPSPPSVEMQRLESVRRLLDVPTGRFRSIRALAGHVGISPYHLIRTFSRAYGLTPWAYHVVRRVEHARGLIERGEPAATVAAMCGFSDQSHLIRHFKRVVGVTPGEYLAPAIRARRVRRV